MKKIILSALVASVTLMASETVSPEIYKSGLLLPPQPKLIYERQCSQCHGMDGKQTHFSGSSDPIAYSKLTGLDADKLAQELKDYRGGIKSKDYQQLNKYGYGALMKTILTDLSWEEIDALAKYISDNLK